jgi:hypothetical protein
MRRIIVILTIVFLANSCAHTFNSERSRLNEANEYIAEHPDMSPTIKTSIIEGVVIRGMCPNEAIAAADRPPVIYPYHASEERAKIIYSNWAKIKENMKESAVVDILGKPDQILPLYEPQVKNSKQIGYSQWYLIQRLKEHGSVNEKGEKLVRISYDMHGIVTQVDHWGF